MKKLLSLISIFNITILTSLTTIACDENDDKQATTNSANADSSEQIETTSSAVAEGETEASLNEEISFDQDESDHLTADDANSTAEYTGPVIPDNEKADLTEVASLHIPNPEVNLTETYKFLNAKIINSKVFKDKHIGKGLVINYYNTQTNGEKINDTKQKTGAVWVEIIAVSNNPHWKGQTKRILITLVEPLKTVQRNLNIIVSQISPIRLNSAQSYSSLNKQIVNNINEFKTKPLAAGYQIDYYIQNMFDIDKIDSNTIQREGIFNVKITAALNDRNWTGYTNKLKFELKTSIKDNLNSLPNDSFIPMKTYVFKANTSKPYSGLNAEISTKINQLTVFKTKPPLARDYQIKYYTRSLLIYSEINSTVKQQLGKVYVEIVPISTDRNWTGCSKKFEIKLT